MILLTSFIINTQQENLVKFCQGYCLAGFSWNRLDFPHAASFWKWCWYLLHLPHLARGIVLLSLSADHMWMKWSLKVITVSTGAKLLPIRLFPPQFSVKPKHFIKCLGMRFRHLIFRLEISFLLGVVPSGHVFIIYPGGRRCNFG